MGRASVSSNSLCFYTMHSNLSLHRFFALRLMFLKECLCNLVWTCSQSCFKLSWFWRIFPLSESYVPSHKCQKYILDQQIHVYHGGFTKAEYQICVNTFWLLRPDFNLQYLQKGSAISYLWKPQNIKKSQSINVGCYLRDFRLKYLRQSKAT